MQSFADDGSRVPLCPISSQSGAAACPGLSPLRLELLQLQSPNKVGHPKYDSSERVVLDTIHTWLQPHMCFGASLCLRCLPCFLQEKLPSGIYPFAWHTRYPHGSKIFLQRPQTPYVRRFTLASVGGCTACAAAPVGQT